MVPVYSILAAFFTQFQWSVGWSLSRTMFFFLLRPRHATHFSHFITCLSSFIFSLVCSLCVFFFSSTLVWMKCRHEWVLILSLLEARLICAQNEKKKTCKTTLLVLIANTRIYSDKVLLFFNPFLCCVISSLFFFHSSVAFISI